MRGRPEGTLAYPDLGVTGSFPTCLGGPNWLISHAPNIFPNNAYFGTNHDLESEGNANFYAPFPYGQDECAGTPSDPDGGLVAPGASPRARSRSGSRTTRTWTGS